MEVKKNLSLSNQIFSGFGFVLIGMMIMIGNVHLYRGIVRLLVLVLLLQTVSKLITIYTNNEKKHQLKEAIGNFIFMFLMLIIPNIPISILPLCFAIYLLFHGCVKLLNYFILKYNAMPHRIPELLLSLFFSLLGFSFLFSPIKHLPTLIAIMGFYFILLGLDKWKDAIIDAIPNDKRLKIYRHFHFGLPVVIDAFLPKKLLNEINHYLNETKDKKEIRETLSAANQKEKVDLEILIHVAPSGFNQFGHMDICIDNRVISYGNYDESSARLFTSIGDGVLFETSRKKYIPFCMKYSNKTLIGFGLSLNEKQKEEVKAELQKIKQTTFRWYSQIETDRMQHQEKQQYQDYASNLHRETGAKFYKFKSGKFKTYFVLGTNCTLFADRIVGSSGTDILKMIGIITPGTYLDYLEEEYRKEKSNVITRTIYHEIPDQKKWK